MDSGTLCCECGAIITRCIGLRSECHVCGREYFVQVIEHPCEGCSDPDCDECDLF